MDVRDKKTSVFLKQAVLAIYSYCKDGVFTALKKGCSVQN